MYKPDGTAESVSHARDRFMLSLVVAIVIMVCMEFGNGILNIVLLDQDNRNADTRATVTRQVIIAAAYCVRLPENNTELEIRQCVSDLLDQPITSNTES